MTTNLKIAPNVTLHAVTTEKFKTGCFSVNLVRPHDRETAALDALLPSVLLRATEKYPDIRSISIALDELYGATLGTLVRRKGEVKLIGFYGDFIEEAFLPEGEQVFAPMLEFLEEVLYHPYTENGCFARNNVEGERQNLINTIEASLNDKRSYVNKRLLEEMCAEESYGIPRLGTVEDAEKITPELLWEHYQKVMRESPIEIFYAGRRPAEEVARLMGRIFAGRTGENVVRPATHMIPCAKQVREIMESMDVTQGKLVMGLRTGTTCDDPVYPAMLLLNAVFGAGMTSKLFVNVREAMSLCYYASSSLDKYKGIMLISSGIAFEDYERAKTAILTELDACKEGSISQDEIEAARLQILSVLRATMDSPAQLDEFCIGNAVNPGVGIEELGEKVAALTVDDLSAAAKRLTLDTVYFLKGVEA